ncbi:MAG TPA: hypothetical protein VK034_28685, partial [Enhygromyxa sp.]|nr:hypothetical protein [Enhygromyxa sp.]
VQLLLPRRLVAGQVARFVVELECPKPLSVDAVSFSLHGHVVWFTTSQYGRHRHSSRFLEAAVALLTDVPGELAAGTHRLETRLRLAGDLPGSWEGDRLAIEYSVVVHVDIPWWPDARVEFGVAIAAAAVQDQPLEGAIVYASHAGGPPAKSPYLELSLGRRTVEPGMPMQISAALGNVDRNRYRKLDVSLIAQESHPTGLGGRYVHEHVFGRWSVGIDNHPGELQPIPFNLDLPRGLAPGFALHDCKLQWLMQVEADVAWGVNPSLRFPITVLPDALAHRRETAAPLAVGSERLRLIWTAVGKALGLDYHDGSLHGRIGACSVEVHRSQRDGEACVIGVLEFPSIGVGLATDRERRGLLGKTALTLTTRDPEQTAVVIELLGERLADGPAELLAADDTSLRFALPGAGLEQDSLREFVGFLLELGPSIERLPDALPAPAAMREHLDAWRDAARSFAASLRVADFQLVFVRDDQALTIATTYDDQGQLRSTEIQLAPGVTIPSRHQLTWTGDFALPDTGLALAELTTAPSWAEADRVALSVEADRIRLFLPAPLPDPTIERPRIEALLAVGRTLRGEQDPYR